MSKSRLKDLFDEAQVIQDFLEQPVNEEPNALSEKLSMMCVYMARSGNMLADAKYLQDVERDKVFTEYYDEISSMPATIASKLIDSKTSEVNYLVNWLERINRACTHQADSIRTIFSYVKENLKMTRNGY